jgi:hypothetical protein
VQVVHCTKRNSSPEDLYAITFAKEGPDLAEKKPSNDNVTQKMQAKMDVDYLGHALTILKVSEKF